MSFIPAEVKLLKYWIHERLAIRARKEAEESKPWTKDPILQQFRFCNVYREDDKVTIWIRQNWREPFSDHPNLYVAMIIARLINWPPALEEIGFPKVWSHKRYLTALQNRKMRGEQIWTGAYMVTAGGRPIPKEEAVCGMISAFHKSPYRPQRGDSLLSCWTALQSQGVSGMGSFLAAQVVADLKFTPAFLEHTHAYGNLPRCPDWYTFCAPGPGSQTGLNHLLGLPLTKQWNREEFQMYVNELMKKVKVPETAQDMQNCLCEFSKYKRGFSRSRYPGV